MNFANFGEFFIVSQITKSKKESKHDVWRAERGQWQARSYFLIKLKSKIIQYDCETECMQKSVLQNRK